MGHTVPRLDNAAKTNASRGEKGSRGTSLESVAAKNRSHSTVAIVTLRTVAQAAPPATLDDLVGAALEHHRSTLAALVRKRVTKLVDELVELELSGRANGVSSEVSDELRPDSDTRGAKRCRSCGQIKPADAYEKHRSVCRSCRREALRGSKQRRQQEPDPEEGHSPAPAA